MGTLIALVTAFLLRFELSALDRSANAWWPWFLSTAPVLVGLRVASFMALGQHRASWRFAGARDVLPLAVSVAAASAVTAPVMLLVWSGWFPRSILIIEFLLGMILLAGARFSFRILDVVRRGAGRDGRVPVVVLGAGSAGNMVVRGMLTGELTDYWPVALLDDDRLKEGTTIQGVPVKGTIDRVAEVARQTGAQAVVLALPTATASQTYRVLRHARRAGLPLKTIPDLARILASSRVTPPISDFSVEDLLNRRPVSAENPLVSRFLGGRTVLVTGAAGSIGSELCRQIAEQEPRRLLCLDRDENGLFRLEHTLRRLEAPCEVVPILADVRERARLADIYGRWRPEAVFHAAAYKHVPVLQSHPAEAVRNNVRGTLNVAELADEYDAAALVLISTDKAVNPTSVMGATKRVAERIVRDLDARSRTRCNVIRFGNVLGSNGSVVEVFQAQIRAGGPVTITHPHIERFFMTVPEAVRLVLCAAALGKGGETFVLDMGDPVRIADLAEQMIRLSGLTPEVDVPVIFTGLRPGEKLYEELWTAAESPRPTAHAGIRQASSEEGLDQAQREDLEALLRAGNRHDEVGCWRYLLRLVPSFRRQPEETIVGAMPPPPVREQTRPAAGLEWPGAAIKPAAAELRAAAPKQAPPS
ncbi:MAG: polysaccharide biosynthesis protein [bacterium]|nr:polysaccharide biosynthesis protein [bacterium]